MPYVRDRLQPKSKKHVQERAAKHRCALDPANAAGNFTGAFDWFRAAAAYAARRSYRTLDIGNGALARREQIIAEAARVLQDCGTEISDLAPASFRPSARRAEYRAAYGRAASPRDQLNAAHAWLLYAVRRAERYERHGAGVKSAASAIRDRAVTRLIEWAEEMDADDYGE